MPAYCFYFTRKDTYVVFFFLKKKPFQTAIGAGLGLILPYLAEQVTAGSVIAGSANIDFTPPPPPRDLNSPGSPERRTPTFAAAGIDRERPGKNPADPMVQPTSVLPWLTTCSFFCLVFFFSMKSLSFMFTQGMSYGKKRLLFSSSTFFPASGGNRVWIHTKGKAIFIKEVPTLPFQTNHSWLLLQLQLYCKEAGVGKKPSSILFPFKVTCL